MTQYLDLADFILIAEVVTGVEASVIAKLPEIIRCLKRYVPRELFRYLPRQMPLDDTRSANVRVMTAQEQEFGFVLRNLETGAEFSTLTESEAHGLTHQFGPGDDWSLWRVLRDGSGEPSMISVWLRACSARIGPAGSALTVNAAPEVGTAS